MHSWWDRCNCERDVISLIVKPVLRRMHYNNEQPNCTWIGPPVLYFEMQLHYENDTIQFLKMLLIVFWTSVHPQNHFDSLQACKRWRLSANAWSVSHLHRNRSSAPWTQFWTIRAALIASSLRKQEAHLLRQIFCSALVQLRSFVPTKTKIIHLRACSFWSE